jgi:hypothetical protein
LSSGSGIHANVPTKKYGGSLAAEAISGEAWHMGGGSRCGRGAVGGGVRGMGDGGGSTVRAIVKPIRKQQSIECFLFHTY